ncbi:MAG: 2-amino-4-hydroxy-6-hydroxymethyldihydropteridine diphosphokinase [Deltaproteobacteria bacterium]|nr:2-amino-4-hydroxy-6-hydroxymethyldihydropteridine diphosphokinase [Deltaproteobacteria bacterium]
MSFDSVTAFIGLGSNLGDRISWLLAGRAALAEMAETEIVGASRLYETAPVGPADQGPYLNSVLALQTGLPARELLNQMLDVEKDQGRVRTRDAERWGPRTLDLDLLLYGELCVEEPGLDVPHPRLHERAFVLQPLCEIVGDRLHPQLGERFDFYLARHRDPEKVRLWSGVSNWKAFGV